MTEPLILPLSEARDTKLVGGKAINLARLLDAHLPVPGGFVVTTQAYRLSLDRNHPAPAVLEALKDAYRALGEPTVAVRSSATAEDMAGASMAGQYETFLGVSGITELVAAVSRCWSSLNSPRTHAYLREHTIEPSTVAMAVVVQELVAAETAGVLFTANPRTGVRDEMLVEAAWGLGEAVVSGRVQPDTARIEKSSGLLIDVRVADKDIEIVTLGNALAERPTDPERRNRACLSRQDLTALHELGRCAERHFGAPQDIEWAIAGGKVWLLQARPITTLVDADAAAQLLDETHAALRRDLDAGHGPWARHNLGETLPHPTPLTWSLIAPFMSGRGGFGAMYREAGFEPSPRACEDGFLRLIAGRVYMDLRRAPEMFAPDYPFAYDVELLRRDPGASQSPPTVPIGTLAEQTRAAKQANRVTRRIAELAGALDRRLANDVFPAFAQWVREEKRYDLGALSARALVDLWETRRRRVLDDFGAQAFLPTMVAALAHADLSAFLAEHVWNESPEDLAHLLTLGGEPDSTMRSNAALFELAAGTRSLDAWMSEWGHRAPGEFDLATPRWRERPEELRALAAKLKGGADPAQLHAKRTRESQARQEQLAGQLNPRDRGMLDRLVDRARRYTRFREDGKHQFMLGYDLLRDIALEAGRRLNSGADVFLLTSDELCSALQTGFAPEREVRARRTRRRAEERLSLPFLIDAEELKRLAPVNGAAGRKGKSDTTFHSQTNTPSGQLEALPVSAGRASGPARIVCSPENAPELGQGYILVCPSTDPSWTPLFVNAAGLVLERGGALSHGAVVAREMGLPAVVLDGATRRLRDGDETTVDGNAGAVITGRETDGDTTAGTPRPEDTRIAWDRRLPPVGRRERWGNRVAGLAALVWGAYLAAVFLLPGTWHYDLTTSIFDALMWPAVPVLGKAGAVVAIAAGFAAFLVLAQKGLTDNRRLLEVKLRAAALRKKAAALPVDAPRRRALETAAGPATARMLWAAMAPIGLILGPMVMLFLWIPTHLDPLSWNAAPGSTVTVMAEVDGEYTGPVQLDVAAPLRMDEVTPPRQHLPPFRLTLESLRERLAGTTAVEELPWPVREAGLDTAQEMLASLDARLSEGIPPQRISWTVRSPEEATGRFSVSVAAGATDALNLQVVLGDRYPPSTTETTRENGPVRALTIVYQQSSSKRVLFAPFAFAGWNWDTGWLLLYVVVYLAVFLPAKALLRVP